MSVESIGGALYFDSADLIADIAARQAAGDDEGVLLLARLGAWRAVDRDIDAETAHSGIHWDSVHDADVAYANRLQADAIEERDALLRCLPICCVYDALRGTEDLREYRAARLPEPVEEDEDA